jgi:hypothetical protein
MNSNISYLRDLEADLASAAEREAVDRSRQAGARSLPRRGPNWRGNRRWPAVAAGIVALLVVAGLVGAFVPRLGGKVGAESDLRADTGVVDASAPPERQLDSPGETNKAFAGYTDRSVRAQWVIGQVDAGDQGEVPVMAAGEPAALEPAAGGDLSKVIRTGSIDLVVADGGFADGLAEASAIAARLNGFVLSSSVSQESSGTLTIRVPSARFDEAMRRLRTIGDVDAEYIQGDDVTAEFMDLQARLKILRGRRALLTKIQREATTSSEILRLGSQIDQVQLQIEKLEGQLHYYRNQVAISTIDVSLREQDAPGPQETDPQERTSLGDAWSRAVDGAVWIVGAVVVGLGYLLPILVLVGLAWFVISWVRRRRQA